MAFKMVLSGKVALERFTVKPHSGRVSGTFLIGKILLSSLIRGYSRGFFETTSATSGGNVRMGCHTCYSDAHDYEWAALPKY